jgi:bifunctional non-homologous end joining protein LigD
MATTKKSTAKFATNPRAKSATKHRAKAHASASNAIDRQLERYREMRDFNVTAEPSGEASNKTKSTLQPQLPFVIQKHAASHLHYDFRLGWKGVLKSWAIAKGPSYLTADKRLAVQVEDHPMEYGGFEGIIPQGQYGGGTVMLWDQGTWTPQPGHTDVDEGLHVGSLKFILDGAKMKGKWALIRMGGKAANERKPNWLLIKEHDEFEYTSEDKPITEAEPNSVVTGRDLDQIAHNEDHVWNSKQTANGNAWYRNDKSTDVSPRSAKSEPRQKATAVKVILPPNVPKERLPAFIPPQLAQQSTTPPTGAGWLNELKLDGYRIQARKDGASVQLLTRTGLDWTHRMKTVAAQVQALPADTAILDGELVVLAPNGTTNFADLQAAFQEGVRKSLTYFAFDLLHLNGHNLRGLPLVERKNLLEQLLKNAGEYLRFSEHLEASAEDVFQKACEFHAEGIVCKRASSRYFSGRSAEWLKLKCIHEQEFVIAGFTLPSNSTHGIGALLLGYYENAKSKDAAQKLIYAGRTGTGFTQKTHRRLRDQLDALRQSSVPFDAPPAEARRGVQWVKPELVAQINFASWTDDNLVRQASFKGVREDKPAAEVRREEPTTAPKPRGGKQASYVAQTPLAAKTASQTFPKSAGKVAAKRSLKPAANQPASGAPIRLTHPDKVLDAETHLTKRQLADYYWAIAPHMLPHIADRPLSLVRCPEGSEKTCFYQKHVNHMLPPGIGAIDVPDKKTGKTEPYITLSTPEALAGLAQMSVLEVHPWGSRNDDLEHPDRMIIDLDPDIAIPWATLTASATEVRKQLKKLGLEAFLKSTGGKGLHIVIPVEPDHSWFTIKQFAHAFALQMEKAEPRLYLTKMSKAARKDRIFIDYLRNERGATAVAPYSPRARAGAAVSLPLHWADLKLTERPIFQVATFDQWRSRLTHDPWKQLPATRQTLTQETRALFKITPEK